MQAPAPAPNEPARLERLRQLEILDTVAEQSLDDVAKIAAHICGTPIALISLVDERRQWFKSKVGLDAAETPRDVSFCGHAVLQSEVFVVEDSLQDSRFFDNPLATGAPHVRFYAGAPLVTDDGLGLGTLCVIDHRPRQLGDEQIECLRGLARQILRQFDLRLMMNQLRRVDALKDEFISNVNHELRTPLTSIRGALSLVNSGAAGAVPHGSMAELLSMAERNSLHLLELVNDLLDMQRIGAGRMNLNLETLELADVVTGAVELCSSYAADEGCTIQWHAPTTSSPISGDRCKIVQVLSNLLSNAAKFSDPGSDIRVELTVDGGHARVAVIDSGAGIPEAARPSIFARFEQVDTSDARSAKGTGLGLSIAKQLVDLHGGTIDFDSRPGQGSTFYFELPLLQPAAAAAPQD